MRGFYYFLQRGAYMAVSLNLITFDESIYTKEEIKKYTNEELINFIHETNKSVYWELLWIKTKNCVFKVFNTSVNSYNKDRNSEEIFSVLMQAWIHAVNTYDKNKATSEFYKYCIFIVRQQYNRYASRTNAEKIGKSVRHVYLDDYVLERTTSEKDGAFSLVEALEDETALEDFAGVELKIDIRNNLEKLKLSMPDVYNYIVGYFFHNKTYLAIAKEHNVNTVTVQRGVKKGLKQLKYYFDLQNKMSI
jgi:DNA-directed RNA polymerase specialized sigma subunit